LEELVWIIIVHEQILKGDEKKSKGINLALKTQQKAKKIISSWVVETSDEDSHESESEAHGELNLLINNILWLKVKTLIIINQESTFIN